MTVKKLLGISLALVMLLGSVPLGFSEPLRVQLEQGVETDQLQCNNPDHVLVQRTTRKLACVTKNTAEKMKLEKITSTKIIRDTKEILIDDSSTVTLNEIDSIEYDAALMSILEADLVITNKEIDSSKVYELGKVIDWPKYKVTFPRTAQVGVPFDVVYDYAYVIPDEETGSYVNFNEQCIYLFCENDHFSSRVSSYVDVVSDNLKFFTHKSDFDMIPLRDLIPMFTIQNLITQNHSKKRLVLLSTSLTLTIELVRLTSP